jgi:hypothetical protein
MSMRRVTQLEIQVFDVFYSTLFFFMPFETGALDMKSFDFFLLMEQVHIIL